MEIKQQEYQKMQKPGAMYEPCFYKLQPEKPDDFLLKDSFESLVCSMERDRKRKGLGFKIPYIAN